MLNTPDKEYIATITRKGQVTIPASVRAQLGLVAQDKIVFRILTDNRVEFEALPMSLEEAYGSVKAIQVPEDMNALLSVASASRVQRWKEKLFNK